MVAFLAPAGRMPLTNYLLQSIAMGALLSGWGLALGPRLSYWQTAVVAMLIVVFQILLSSLWLGPMKMRQGPLEALWRAWTYRGLYQPQPATLEPQADLDRVAVPQARAPAPASTTALTPNVTPPARASLR